MWRADCPTTGVPLSTATLQSCFRSLNTIVRESGDHESGVRPATSATARGSSRSRARTQTTAVRRDAGRELGQIVFKQQRVARRAMQPGLLEVGASLAPRAEEQTVGLDRRPGRRDSVT